VEGLLPKVGTSLIAATPKTGKGTLTRQLCVAIANGEPFLGRTTVKGRTLFCSRQEMLSDTVEKLKRTNSGRIPNVLVSPVDLPMPGRDAEAKIRAILVEAREYGEPVSFVVLDMLSSFFKMKEGHYDEAFAALEPIQELAVEFGTHLCVNHHGNKATTPESLSLNSVMGSAAISGSVDTILGICRDPKTDQRCVASWQRTGKEIQKHWLDWDDNTLRVVLGKPFGNVESLKQKHQEKRDKVEKFVNDNPGCSFNQIHTKVGGRLDGLQNILDELVESKRIYPGERTGKGGGTSYFPVDAGLF
jgi:AAA domain